MKIGGRGQWRVERSRLEDYIAGLYRQAEKYAAEAWRRRDDIELLTWREVSYYEHYRAVLQEDVGDTFFARKAQEVVRTREIFRPAPTADQPDGETG